jgi:hypothetical protein
VLVVDVEGADLAEVGKILGNWCWRRGCECNGESEEKGAEGMHYVGRWMVVCAMYWEWS